jgi:hypothetical protein
MLHLRLISICQMGYGRSGLLTSLASKARAWVTSRYNIPGKHSPAALKDMMMWLLKDGHFKYGDVDLTVCSILFYLFIILSNHLSI